MSSKVSLNNTDPVTKERYPNTNRVPPQRVRGFALYNQSIDIPLLIYYSTHALFL
jgi:hypothetical protein